MTDEVTPAVTTRATAEREHPIMRTTPATWAEADSWLAVLHQRGHLHRVETGPDGTRSVQRGRHPVPWTLHHPVLALDFIEDLLLDIRQRETEAGR
ncbi:hypothetical protein ACFY4B_41810 [Kitasatospora sp. NPDC001261]|uniref:hypothetical protein n=1 Tax=Kitasatospora sp. NPDC001261 TaxID=3364012 RepID=UPI0036997FF0